MTATGIAQLLIFFVLVLLVSSGLLLSSIERLFAVPVGFDSSRTRAIVTVRHQADYEMGIGYRIYLEKSAATGRWLITGTDLTYRS